MAYVPEWLWLTAGWGAIALGAWLVLAGRVRWRRRSGRRCRGCDYDMQGIGSLKCPECGRVAQSEKDLRGLAGRRSLRLAGVALAGLGWLCTQGPAIARHGLPGAAPDWVLAWIAPVRAEDADVALARGVGMPSNRPLATPPPPVTSLHELVTSALYLETWRRINQNEMSPNAAAGYLRRMFNPTDEYLRRSAKVPSHWPWDVDFPAVTALDSPGFATPIKVQRRIEGLSGPGGSATLIAEVQGHEIGRTTVAVDASRDRKTFMDRADTPESGAAVAAALRPALVVAEYQVWVEFRSRSDAAEWRAAPWALYLRIRVLRAGQEIGTGWCDAELLRSRGRGKLYGLMTWTATGEAEAIAHPDEIELELTGDAVEAADQFVFGKVRTREAWAGTVRVRPSVQRSP